MPAFNNPPALTISKSYETLKTEIKMWETLTPLPANKRALAIAVRLSGTALEAIMTSDADQFSTNPDVKLLLEDMDKILKKDSVDLA